MVCEGNLSFLSNSAFLKYFHLGHRNQQLLMPTEMEILPRIVVIIVQFENLMNVWRSWKRERNDRWC